VKLGITRGDEESFVILTMANTIELEGELKLRFNSFAQANRAMRIPFPMYVGMFAGATKPKPFQRKRPNLSRLPTGKLPQLHDMRAQALQLHRGSYRPCPQGESRRVEIAMQHIHEGANAFTLLGVRGPGMQGGGRGEAVLLLTEDMMIYRPNGKSSKANGMDFPYEDIKDWTAIDNDNRSQGDSGIEIESFRGDRVFFGVMHVRDVKHSLEFFWNRYQVSNGGEVKLGSTHGRPLVTVTTLSGELPPPERPLGSSEVVDQDGCVVRPGARIIARRQSALEGLMSSKPQEKTVPLENRIVKQFWHKVVVHQGWLLKKGGIGLGEVKSWIKRYFVLYSTSQGHFLVYYESFTECPLYTEDRNQRNVVDLSKATFIRPGSNKSEQSDTPPHSFDIVTTEREWTLCAESQENVQKWLKLITRAVDEDVAVLPDEELLFKVKPKVDPLGVLPSTDYSTSLKVSANGISVCTPNASSGSGDREHYFWTYTDFYKWSLLSQSGKLALLVNVFADSSFSRRNEYIFRNKEAVRLATAIEYFIEKFMTVMHLRLELEEGAFDGDQEVAVDGGGGAASRGMNMMNDNEWQDDAAVEEAAEELDLLGLDSPPSRAGGGGAAAASSNGGGKVDPFSSTFGEEPRGAPPVPPSNPAPSSDPFGDDFGSSSSSSSSVAAKTAPPLTATQIEQHKVWFSASISNFGGPLYTDGVLQIATKVEIRGSQGRITFFYRNLSPAAVTELSLTIVDPSGLIRFEFPPCNPVLNSMSDGQSVLMLECMKPASPGPQIVIAYNDTLLGKRSNTISLPVLATSFNEPLSLSAADFTARWDQLVGPGQQLQEVFSPSNRIVAAQVTAGMTSALRFGRITGMPDESEYVIYGAASLRTGAVQPSGEKISVGCLVKIEMDVGRNALRITARTLHPAATQTLFACARSLLG